MKSGVYSGIDQLPRGSASRNVTPGCVVLEGGAFRGVYTSGVLDALMREDINFQCAIGVSAGAMNGMNYISGQIGRSGRINLIYRHDSRYVGLRALRGNRGIIGFDFLFGQPEGVEPFDRQTFERPDRQFVAVAASCITGEAVYLEKGTCDIEKAVQASASMPYVSKPVSVNGVPCLDGGCAVKIPVQWALANGFSKIVVVRTREDNYRKAVSSSSRRLAERVYGRKYPAFARAVADSSLSYNHLCDELQTLRDQGRIFIISPSSPVTVQRLEGDMEKLGALYHLGYQDTLSSLGTLREYLEK